MATDWYRASELAGLPGMPSTHQNVKAKANREGWKSRPYAGKGGGLEYHITSLPRETQDHLLLQQLAAVAPALPAPVEAPAAPLTVAPEPASTALVTREIPASGTLTAGQRQTRDARLTVLTLVDELTRTLGSQGKAVTRIEAMSKEGTLPPGFTEAVRDANARSGRKTKGEQATRLISRATLYRIIKSRDDALAAADGNPTLAANALAPRAIAPRDRPVWLSPLLALYQDPLAKPTVALALRALEQAAQPGIVVPPLRTAQHHIAKLPAVVREYGRQGARARRAIQPFVRRSTDGLWPMDVVAVDGHALKAYVQHPLSGDYFHPEVTTYLDIATRYVVGWSAWLAESQYTIWLALRHVVLDPRRGIPAIQYSDNGAYTGAEHLALLARLGITPTNSRAYNPQANGAVERINQTIWRDVAAKLLPTGKQVDKEAFQQAMKRAKTVGDNLPSWDAFLGVAQTRIDEYNTSAHERLRRGRTKISPRQAWDEALAEGWQPTLLQHDALHDLLPSEERTCRRGEVVVQGRIYFSRDLTDHHQRTVRVASDPHDGQRVWVSDLEGRLICVAERDGNTRHYIADDKLAHAIEQRKRAAVARKQKILDQVEARETPVIAGRAIDLPDLALPAPGMSADLPAIDLTRLAAPPPAAVITLYPARSWIDDLDNDAARFDAWRDLERQLSAGQAITDREREFHAAFGQSEYCRRTQQMWADWEASLANQSAR